jgi:exopolysaccharide production protein ExoZ
VSDSTGGEPKLNSLQLLRALAAVAVVFGHFQFDMARYVTHETGLPNLMMGNAGVDLFFVLSGFVIVYASEHLFAKPAGQWTFFQHRLIRIVPLYWIITTIYIAIAAVAPAFDKSYSAATILGSYFFIPVPRLDGIVEPIVGQGWTLNYEMLFYVVFAVAVAAPRRLAVAAATFFLIGLVFIGRLVDGLPTAVSYWADPIVLEFIFGMGIALAYRQGVRLPRPGAVALIVAGFIAFALFPMGGTPRALVWGIPAALIVAGSVFGSFALDARGWHVPIIVGNASYALYLIHSFAVRGTLFGAKALSLDVARAPWLYLLVAVAAAVVLGIIVHYTVERPLIAALRRLAKLNKSVTAEPRKQVASQGSP